MMMVFMLWQKNYQWSICYDQVHASVRTNTNPTTTSTVTKEIGKDSKTKLIIAILVIVLVLSAICVCTIYMLLELSRLKSEIASKQYSIFTVDG